MEATILEHIIYHFHGTTTKTTLDLQSGIVRVGVKHVSQLLYLRNLILMYAPRGLMLGSALVFQANKNTFLGF